MPSSLIMPSRVRRRRVASSARQIRRAWLQHALEVQEGLTLFFDAAGGFAGAVPATHPEAPPAACAGLSAAALGLPAPLAAALQHALDGAEAPVAFAYAREHHGDVCRFEGQCVRRAGPDGRARGVTVALREMPDERRRVSALFDAVRRFQTFYDGLSHGLFLLGVAPDGGFHYVHANPAHVNVSGVPNDVLAGQPPEALLAPDTAAIVTAHYRRCVETGQPVSYELTFEGAKGQRIVQTQVLPIANATGRIDLLVGLSHDITDLRTAEQARAGAFAHLQQVLDRFDSSVWTINAATRTLDFYNAATLRFLGLDTAPDDVEATWDAAIHPDDSARAAQAFGEMWETGTFDLDYRLIQPDGRIRWIHDVGKAVRDDAGTLQYIIGVGTDVTERIVAALELQDARDRLSEILDRVDDAVWSKDAETGEMDFYNDAALRLLGLDEAPHDLRPAWVAAIHPEDQGSTHAAFAAMWETATLDVDYRIVRADGELRWVHDRGHLVCDEEGHPLRVVGIASDVTARIEAAHTLAQARDDAETATRAKSAFLATMSHEIRTPMNGLVACADLLLGTPLNDEQRDLSGTLLRSATHLVTLINDLLDLSKIEAGRLELEHAAFRLGDVVDDVGRLHEHAARVAGLAFRVEVAADVPAAVMGDAGRLRQILSNLLSNAVRFTEHGFVALRVEPAEAGTVRFLVEDSGVGIEPHVLPKLFEAFTQADASTTRRYGGTGLGLNIVRRLTEAMGGEVGVESMPGEGSCFFITLPLEAVQDLPSVPAALPTPPSAPGMSDAPVSSSPAAAEAPVLRILVAEDNAVNRAVIERMLVRIGHTPTFAANGQEALDALGAAPYDLVLMDVQMPVLDGVEATRQLRERETTTGAHQYVVALTANALPGDRERYLASGMDDYLSKPLTLATLRDTLARFISADGRTS